MEKQEEILIAALPLFVEYGFHGTPTSKIAAEAKVANGTLFHYFKTKDELILALYFYIKEKMNCSMESYLSEKGNFKDTFKTLFLGSLNWALNNTIEFRFVQQFHSSPFQAMVTIGKVSKQLQRSMGLIQQAIDDKVLHPLPIDLIVILVSSHIFGVFQYLTSTSLSEEKRAEVMQDAFESAWKMIT